MNNIKNYLTHIDNEDDLVFLKTKHMPVNMRLFNTSSEYRDIILAQCNYIKKMALATMIGYKKPHGMSSANLGLGLNIIGVVRFRNQPIEFCEIMINPIIIKYIGSKVNAMSNCGSITLNDNILIKRFETVKIGYFTEDGLYKENIYGRDSGSFTIQHEIDHNNGILITDYNGS